MTFRNLIEGMNKKDPLIRGGAIAGTDGLAVEEWQVSPPSHDLAALCAEMSQFFKESRRIAGENGLGESCEVVLATDRGTVFVRRVTEDYLLLLVADPSAIPGKCRFFLKQGARRAVEML
jgi:predicted regulator of Ras-like GTPase activity (Roadblock/LC7/MglB family)